MKKKYGRLLLIGFCLLFTIFIMAGCSGTNSEAEAHDDFPNKTINIYSPYSPGGYVDIITRQLADQLEDELGVTVNVSDRSGGGGIVAMTEISNQDSDGYTLSAATDISHMHFENVDYEIDDFTYVASMAYAHHPVIVRSDSEWESMDDLLEYAKENPGSLKWGSGGIVNPVVLAARELFDTSGVETEQVPYNGGSEVLSALLGGDIDVGVIADFKSSLESGSIKLLAESSLEANPSYPDVKTLEELGLTGEGPPTVYGIVGPKDIPDEVVEAIDAAMEKVINSDEYKNAMDKLGVQAFYRGSEDYEKLMFEEDERLGEVVPKYLNDDE
ncbi:Bug family tripartite tricarboxylate transporter substrate binding protein [Oceanobacillus alkalisoli]|uniref:Bug family tripartite tricarboxylate transporter substrate binding protein n=1 Tax=Oceanobacillus alkalisoli TaxID=2925113 RepID=UPI001EE3D88F|nr:tripartite tricarboxylate transporter substrate binding protein [Oceanobacillus alkalisoli]MCG5103230.1 tripartite tricarboxylate transporter substrate binding protein [Oceanobacillus alkalisoli]